MVEIHTTDCVLINTRFSGVTIRSTRPKTVLTVLTVQQTVETVRTDLGLLFTPLKRGANESFNQRTGSS